MDSVRRNVRGLAALGGAFAALVLGGVFVVLPPVSAAAEEAPATATLHQEQALPNTPYRAMGGLRATRERERAIRQAARQPRIDLDCTFFDSQAFNQQPDHFTSRMAEMCAMLSAYKEAVIATNSARYKATLGEAGANPFRPPLPERMTDMPGTTDAGKYLIAREIGLIDALER
ncbi:MAG: hypothetical protein AAF899_07315 [Pseudomonadota bacterium]